MPSFVLALVSSAILWGLLHIDPFIPLSIRHLHFAQSAICSKNLSPQSAICTFNELLFFAGRENLKYYRVLYT